MWVEIMPLSIFKNKITVNEHDLNITVGRVNRQINVCTHKLLNICLIN